MRDCTPNSVVSSHAGTRASFPSENTGGGSALAEARRTERCMGAQPSGVRGHATPPCQCQLQQLDSELKNARRRQLRGDLLARAATCASLVVRLEYEADTPHNLSGTATSVPRIQVSSSAPLAKETSRHVLSQESVQVLVPVAALIQSQLAISDSERASANPPLQGSKSWPGAAQGNCLQSIIPGECSAQRAVSSSKPSNQGRKLSRTRYR
ncbi:unnamed protein product [Hermetia illucens]|uniref:Uncharacterized protein n=1 Tax=Hermetia illucens TaxID=343691 RepID=A0A7R8YYX4_HERIL|nr:unnamed protein product [Hermetia illucens]